MAAISLLKRAGSRWQSLPRRDKACVGAILAMIGALNAAGWGIFTLAILPRHFHYGGLGTGIGVALTAWTLGCRHAFDADHIAAIDNSTRKLITDGKRPIATGFFFALGHSSIIAFVGVGIAIAARSVFHAVVTPTSTYETAGGVAGTAMAGTFLLLIGALNLVVFLGIWRLPGPTARALQRSRTRGPPRVARADVTVLRALAALDQAQLAALVRRHGVRDWIRHRHRGTAARRHRHSRDARTPVVAVLALPLLFAGGMTLFDSLDGFSMSLAYDWAFARPVRKIFYNLTITGLSVAVAFVIGGIELIGLLSSELHLPGRVGAAIANVDLNTAGFVVVGLFLAIWALAAAVWRLGRVEERWDQRLTAERPNQPTN